MSKALTEKQRAYILANQHTMTISELAKKVRIGKNTVIACINGEDLDQPDDNPVNELADTIAFKQLKEELSAEELAYFCEAYNKYVKQFKNEVYGTEQTQLFILIKLEIMMHRNSKGKKQASDTLSELAQKKERIQRKYKLPEDISDADAQTLIEYDNQIAQLRSAEAQKSTEFTKLSDDHQKILRDLKATRDQRMARVDSSKESFLAILRELQDEDEQLNTARQLELVKKATTNELNKLAKVHEYEDGKQDIPILNADTVEPYESN